MGAREPRAIPDDLVLKACIGRPYALMLVGEGHPCEMRKQYSFWPGESGLDAWDVDRLIALSAALPVEELPLADIEQLDEDYWYDHGYVPTVRSIAERVSLVLAADLKYPIILAPDGRVLDGMHRVVRALVDGRSTVSAVRLPYLPAPDYTDCRPEDLPYSRP